VVGGQVLMVPQRAKNPVPVKAALGLLGVMPDAVRAPLGAIGPNGLARVRSVLRLTLRRHPELLQPLAQGFGLDLAARLETAVEMVRIAR
jgi:hypothetical protein